MRRSGNKIVLDLRIADLSNGGVARYAQEMGRLLPTMDRDNRYLKIRIRKDDTIDDTGETILVDIGNESKSERKAFISKLTQIQPDLYHSFWFVPEPAPLRQILTLYDNIIEMDFPEYRLPGAVRRKRLLRKYLPSLDGIICISDTTRRDMESIYGFKKDHIAVTYLASDLNWDQESLGKLSRHFGIRRPFLFFFGHGMDTSYKNFHSLLKAFSRIEPADVQLVVCGGSSQSEDLWKDTLNDLNIKSRVIFTGYLSDNELFTILKNATVMVYPSLYEGFGLPLLEAMSAGVPVAAGNVGAIPEVAEDSIIYFDPRDPHDMTDVLNQLIACASLRKELIARGKKRSESFSWQRTAEQTLIFYKEVLKM